MMTVVGDATDATDAGGQGDRLEGMADSSDLRRKHLVARFGDCPSVDSVPPRGSQISMRRGPQGMG